MKESLFDGTIYVGLIGEEFCDIYLLGAQGDIMGCCDNVPIFLAVDAIDQGFVELDAESE